MGYIYRLIAYSFQVIVDLYHRAQKTQIHGNGLVQGQDLETFLFDFYFRLINLIVLVYDLLRKLPSIAFMAMGTHSFAIIQFFFMLCKKQKIYLEVYHLHGGRLGMANMMR